MFASRTIPFFALAASLAGVQAQSTTPFTDAATGITFQQYSAANGFSFGIALPEQAGADFIGRISASTTGWAAVTLTGSMRNSLLAVAWPNGESVYSSLRTTTGYTSPGVFNGDAVIKTIPEGTSINSTGFTFTFLCERCIVEGRAFDPTAETGVLGWAMSSDSPTTPSSVSSPLQFHDQGFGGFGVDLAGAKSAEFATWAALATGTTPPPPTGGNQTVPAPPNNGTIPVSNSTWDYIVVGGGASGLVVSQRLAEAGKSVLVLERGGPSFYSSGGDLVVPWNNTLTAFEVPGLFSTLPNFPGNDAYCSDTPEIAGCILGGGTAVNGLQFVRPPSFDFENWPENWQWATTVEAAAARVYERNPGSTSPSMDGRYYDNAVYDVASNWLSGAGWSYADSNEEPDAKFQTFTHPAINTIDGLRAGPVRTYLPLAAGLSNFKLQLHTKVIRAVRTKSAVTGVEVEDDAGQRQIINVNQGGKVILAAGAMSSPRILFNSGIGPTDQINIVKSGNTAVTLPAEEDWINLPVGFVRDHVYINLNFNVKGNMTTMKPEEFTSPSNETLALYAHGSGPLAQSFNRAMSYTTITNDDGHKTLSQAHISSAAENTISFLVALTHGVTSTGTLGITPDGNTEWTVSPYLTSASDKEAMAKAIDELLAISRQPNSTLSFIGSANATGASIVASSSPLSGVHMTGTTIMGTEDGTKNGSSVVDTNCKVWGTDNLFVVDAGMHPDLPTGNTQAIVMVAAEAAVEKIIALGAGAANETATSPENGTPSSASLLPSAAPVPTNGYPAVLPTLNKPAVSATSTPYRGRPVRGSGKGRWGWQ
ncbi:cellobiose dehydrogenase [Paraphoma chrysanthemicola]|uniref:Cellobiose dehydrogenase n=1 Tax=Paraphoma chrysanthemicola TaxID=798071 RepID=A0A8K0RE62_9PLEO|nr:cellobiose dehydrogenase [Paraphoma chrysanthemicola]